MCVDQVSALGTSRRSTIHLCQLQARPLSSMEIEKYDTLTNEWVYEVGRDCVGACGHCECT